MAVMIRLTLVLCVVSSSLLGQEIEKQYVLCGVDDSLHYSVSVAEDLEKDVATFSVNENAVKIFGVRGIEGVTIHSDTFLEVQFRARGGSGVGVKEMVLLCVSHGRIYRTLELQSELTSRVDKVYDKVADSLHLFDEKEDYRVTISVKKRGPYYKAILLESDTVVSKYDPSQNVAYEKTYELDFDLAGYFFYNSMKRLNKRFKVYSVKDNKVVEKFISAEVPCIELYQGYYVLMDNEWCANNGGDTLSCR